MTALDRSFIKVFADSVPAASAGNPQAPAAGRSEAASIKLSSPTSGHRPPTKPSIPITKAPAALAPLSSFAAPIKADEPLHAMLEVDHLTWPNACQSLLSGARESWDHFADRLAEQRSQGIRSIAIVSCARGEGRTTVTLSTARHMAARGLRPLVVDADFEHPTLAASCGVSAPMGWGDVLEGKLPVGEALIASVSDGVTLMPWRGPARQTAQLCGTARIAETFRLLQDAHDLVLMDTRPLKNQADVTELASLAKATGLQAVYLIHDVRFTTLDQLTNTCARLRRAEVAVAGIIENFLSPPKTDDDEKSEESSMGAGHTLAAYG